MKSLDLADWCYLFVTAILCLGFAGAMISSQTFDSWCKKRGGIVVTMHDRAKCVDSSTVKEIKRDK